MVDACGCRIYFTDVCDDVFLQSYFDGTLQSAGFYIGIIAALAVVMYVLVHINYNTFYSAAFKECKELYVNIADLLKDCRLALVLSCWFYQRKYSIEFKDVEFSYNDGQKIIDGKDIATIDTDRWNTLARTLLKNAPIIILDEISASLDVTLTKQLVL